MEITINSYLTIAIAVIVYYIGVYIKKRVQFLQKYCIPAPVVGGLICSALLLVLHQTQVVKLTLDSSFQEFFMLMFFCSIGFTARLKMLKKGGIQLVLMVILSGLLCVVQNGLGAAVISLFGQHPLMGVAVGSVPLVGGYGTSAAFGPLIEEMGVPSAATASYAAATFGMICGCVVGGPLARMRIMQQKKRGMAQTQIGNIAEESPVNESSKCIMNVEKLMLAAALLLLGVGFGTIISDLLGRLMTFSAAVGSLMAGCIIRNVCDFAGLKLPDDEIDMTGEVTLNIFLAMAMMSMELWLLVDLAVPLIVTLVAEVIVTSLFSYYLVYWLMGRDYDAAVMVAGTIGFGCGSTSNAVASMNAVTAAYGPAVRAFIIIPIVGSMLADLMNSAVITVFMNILG